MRKRWLAPVAALVLMASSALAAGTDGGKGTKQPAGAGPAGVVYQVNGTPITIDDALFFLSTNITMRHRYRIGKTGDTFEELTRRLVDLELLYQEGQRIGVGKDIDRGTFRFRRNTITAADYLLSVVKPGIVVPDAEVEALMPHDLRIFTLRQILLETEEDAKAVGQLLAKGGDFVDLVRKASVGMESRKDGLLWEYRAGGGIFEEADEKYLFSLPLNRPSRPIKTGLGWAIVRVEKAREPQPGYGAQRRARIRQQLATKAYEERVHALLATEKETLMDRERLYPLVASWWEKGVVADVEVGRAAGNVITFPELVEWQSAKGNISLKPNTDEMAEKLAGMLKDQLDDSIIAAIAAREGHVTGKAALDALAHHRREAVLAEMTKRLVLPKVVVAPGELRPYWELHREDFKIREAVEVRHILTRKQAEAERVIKDLAAGKKFEDLAKQLSTDAASKEKGGYVGFIERGLAVQAFEDAAFALKGPGATTKRPVKTAFGYHVVQLVSYRPAKDPPFEEVEPSIRAMLTEEKKRAAQGEIVARLRSAAQMTIDEKNLSALRERFVAIMDAPDLQPKKGHH